MPYTFKPGVGDSNIIVVGVDGMVSAGVVVKVGGSVSVGVIIFVDAVVPVKVKSEYMNDTILGMNNKLCTKWNKPASEASLRFR
jgi:hypothetical protein